MKVLFLQDVLHVGKKGDIKEVKPGYAAHMLFPKSLAVRLTPEIEKQYQEKLRKEDKYKRELIENRHKLSTTLNGQKLTFTLKTGPKGKVFGGIGEKDIITKIKNTFKIELSKKHIELPEGHIKRLGEHQIFIKLGKDAISKMCILVVNAK